MFTSLKKIVGPILFLVVVPSIAQWLFSWMGFNPTDEGFTLAYSRRLLEGEIPHRDFIIIRPFLSPLLHVPFVYWGGNSVFWISRYFAFFQFAVFALSLTTLIHQRLNRPFYPLEKYLVSLLVFMISIHIFPIMAWHTLDGLFFIALGLPLCFSKKSSIKGLGYFLLALAYLCKQSYLFVAPITLVILNDGKAIKNWVAISLPGLAYLIFLLMTQAFSDAWIQLTSQHHFLDVGFYNYLSKYTALGLAFGFGVALFCFKDWIKLVVFIFIPIFCFGLSLRWGEFISISLFIFGLLSGIGIHSLYKKQTYLAEEKQLIFIFLIIGWSAALSLACYVPIFGAGPNVALLLGLTLKRVKAFSRITMTYFIIGLVVWTSFHFVFARNHYVYRDGQKKFLTRNLGDVFSGGMRIKTNPNTYIFLKDLNKAIAHVQAQGKKFMLLPELASYWVNAQQRNPLPIDWLYYQEVNSPEIKKRISESLKNKDENTLILVEKVGTYKLPEGFFPVEDSFLQLISFIHNHFSLIGETDFFEIYQ